MSTLIGADGKTQMRMARLRTTFVTYLLRQPNLSQGEILQLAGLASTASLDLYREFIPQPDLDHTARVYATLPSILNGDR